MRTQQEGDQLSARKGPNQELTLLTQGPQTSTLQNCEIEMSVV